MTLKETSQKKSKGGKKQNSIGARISAIALHDCGISFEQIFEQTGVLMSACYKLLAKAKERGWKPGVSMIVQIEHVSDAPRLGRPSIP